MPVITKHDESFDYTYDTKDSNDKPTFRSWIYLKDNLQVDYNYRTKAYTNTPIIENTTFGLMFWSEQYKVWRPVKPANSDAYKEYVADKILLEDE